MTTTILQLNAHAQRLVCHNLKNSPNLFGFGDFQILRMLWWTDWHPVIIFHSPFFKTPWTTKQNVISICTRNKDCLIATCCIFLFLRQKQKQGSSMDLQFDHLRSCENKLKSRFHFQLQVKMCVGLFSDLICNVDPCPLKRYWTGASCMVYSWSFELMS